MSFIDDIVDFGSSVLDVGKSVVGYLGGNSIGSQLAKTALLGFAMNQISKNVNKQNNLPQTSTTPEPDRGVRLQVNPDTNHKIPVVYGSAHLGGIITDAQISNNNLTMHYVITICEKTGTLLSDDSNSVFTFEDIYWNDQRIVFDIDGRTAAYTVDRDSNVDYSVAGQVKVYCYAGSSNSPVLPDNYSSSGLQPAYSIVPNWTSAHTMNDLIFAVIRVDYNKEKGITQIPDIRFHITNSMTQPGDCLYDYMTNTRYGAGIDPTEIYSE